MLELKLKLPTDPRAATAARRGLGALAGFIEAGELDVIELLTSEVVTNSIKHSGASSEMFINIDVSAVPERVHVSVKDSGPGFDAHIDDSEPSERVGRWGLLLVDRLSERWGVDTSGFTTVWFDVTAQS